MLKSLCSIAAGLAALLVAAAPAAAHRSDEDHFHVWRPYVIVKDCDDEFRNCKARMEYAPGQHAGASGRGQLLVPPAGPELPAPPQLGLACRMVRGPLPQL